MKLYHNPASPYVRKVLVVAHETGLADRIEIESLALTPVTPDSGLNAANPLGKIPALALDDGTTLFDSRVICEYLDTLHHGAAMFPSVGPARWRALLHQATADGILDAAVITRYETALRPEALRWPDWIENQKLKFRRALGQLEPHAEGFAETIDIGTVAVGCALGYLDFRYPDEAWRPRCPNLARWFEHFSTRASMQATLPAELR
jgi:glutathione S-transferase